MAFFKKNLATFLLILYVIHCETAGTISIDNVVLWLRLQGLNPGSEFSSQWTALLIQKINF